MFDPETLISRCYANCAEWLTRSQIESGFCPHCGAKLSDDTYEDLSEYLERQAREERYRQQQRAYIANYDSPDSGEVDPLELLTLDIITEENYLEGYSHMKPLGYFNQFPQGEALVTRFGDYNMDGLPRIDQCALLVILSGAVYLASAVGDDSNLLRHAANVFFPGDTYDVTTDAINEALDILDGINRDQAIGLIAFLTQG